MDIKQQLQKLLVDWKKKNETELDCRTNPSDCHDDKPLAISEYDLENEYLVEFGLDDTGNPLPKSKRPLCGARTRFGRPCKARVVPEKRRCRMHGGLSTGPKSQEGCERIAQAQRQRWQKWRAEQQSE